MRRAFPVTPPEPLPATRLRERLVPPLHIALAFSMGPLRDGGPATALGRGSPRPAQPWQ